MPIFRVKSVKIYTGQKKIYTKIFVAFVTNMRYVSIVPQAQACITKRRLSVF